MPYSKHSVIILPIQSIAEIHSVHAVVVHEQLKACSRVHLRHERCVMKKSNRSSFGASDPDSVKNPRRRPRRLGLESADIVSVCSTLSCQQFSVNERHGRNPSVKRNVAVCRQFETIYHNQGEESSPELSLGDRPRWFTVDGVRASLARLHGGSGVDALTTERNAIERQTAESFATTTAPAAAAQTSSPVIRRRRR